MQKLLKNKKLLAIVLCAVLIVTISGVGAFAALAGDLITGGSSSSEAEDPSSSESSSQSSSGSESQSHSVSQSEQEPVKFNKPDEMRAVYLQPGEDFLNSKDSTAEQMKANIDKAISDAISLDMNTIIVPLSYEGGAIFRSASLPAATKELDILQYLLEKARASSLYVYGVYDLTPEILTDSTPMTKVDSESLDEVYAALKELASGYAVDGILLDGYYYPGEDSYAAYKADGAGMGYDNYLYQSSYKLVKTAADAIADGSAGIQIGLAVDAVWANKADNEAGSDTSASFQALYDGHADTRKMIEDQLFDFVAVKAFGATGSSSVPFETVVSWWASLTQSQELPLYVIHAADKICTTEEGWSAPEELAKQYNAAKGIAGCQGSAFNSLSTLLSNPKDATEYLTQMFTGEVKTEHILTELVLTKPAKTTYTTSEVNVTFVGASALDYPLTVNGEDVSRDGNGAFTLVKELKAGLNTFTFEHKDKTITYNITRQVNVIDAGSVTPIGSVALEGGMKLSISAMAYDGAAVTATVGGQTVTLQQTKVEDENTDRESAYKKFVGEITVPAATSSVQNLGSITVTATWQGISGKATGATVSVNKKASQTQVVPGVDTGTGQLIEVTATSAETFPTNVLDDISDPDCYPLAKGTRDYLASDLLTYKDGNTTYTYYILQSGQRVYAKDIKMVDGDINNNVIDNLTVTSDGTYTKVILSTKQPVAYKAYYSSGSFSLAFSYTTEVPTSLSLTKNPLFSSANWDGSTLQLKFRTTDGFLGYKAYYENGNLVFRFNSPPVVSGGSLSGVRISIDPGHCSTDPGALGFLSDYPEQYITKNVSKYLKDELTSRGAQVYMTNTQNGYVSLESRMSQAKSIVPHVVISVHANSAASASAKGSEGWYFNSFSRNLAAQASSKISSALGTTNRGAKEGLFYMTRDSEFAGILMEYGFVTNSDDYYKMIEDSYQRKLASATADAIYSFLANMGSNGATGTESTGSSSGSGGGSSSSSSGEQSSTSASSSEENSASSGSSGSGVEATILVEGAERNSSGSGFNLRLSEYMYVLDYELESEGEIGTVSWVSTNTDVAEIDKNGALVLKQTGSTTLRLLIDGQIVDYCTIRVQ